MKGRAFTTEALLLRSMDRGDDDKVVFLLTPSQGRVAALARRARGSRLRFGAALQPFCRFEAALHPRDGGFFYLDSVAALEFPLGHEASLQSLTAGWLFLDLADALADDGGRHDVFFELILGGLRRLGLGVESTAAVRLSVLWGSLALAGWAPDLERCCACASRGPWPDLGLDAVRGGLLCPACRGAGSAVLGCDALERWKELALGLPLGSGGLAEAEAGLLRWIEHHAGRALRSADFGRL